MIFHINPEEIERRVWSVNKMFNVARFASIFDVPADLDTVPNELNAEDDWILAEFQHVMETVRDSWESIDIYTATQTLKTFATEYFHLIGLRCPNQDCMMEIVASLGQSIE